VLVVVGGALGLGLSYGLVEKVQERATNALANAIVIEEKVGELRERIDSLDETIKNILALNETQLSAYIFMKDQDVIKTTEVLP